MLKFRFLHIIMNNMERLVNLKERKKILIRNSWLIHKRGILTHHHNPVNHLLMTNYHDPVWGKKNLVLMKLAAN